MDYGRRVSIYRTWTQQLNHYASTPYNCRVEYTRVLGKHQASEDAYMAKLACCQLMLELLGDPKSFLDALVTCGRTCWWCAPVVAVLNTTGSQMYYIS